MNVGAIQINSLYSLNVGGYK